ncbi:hypothetical protein H072_583 [Dactylellina haptotyla CBS 200.50]|uniref:Uncharacterized protein n=1 Tax=Dactylellina haptotyla (strain CBS 200.50) TaxID=1284197 RepID=S8C0X3_DACHA|nr:hypothetical protein H072_583 [Dactylellina haptotyla CBS 200.50]
MFLRNIFLSAAYALVILPITHASPVATRLQIDNLAVREALAARTPAPAPPSVQNALKKRATSGTSIKTVSLTFYSTTLQGGDYIKIVSRTETATANNNGPTPSSKFAYHWKEQINVAVSVDNPTTYKTYSSCKAETSFYMSGPNLNSLWISPVTCVIKVVYPNPNLPEPSRCTNTIGTKSYNSALGATATSVYDCLLKKNTLKYTKSGTTRTRYQKDDFAIERSYDSRNWAWFEACYNGPDPSKRSLPPQFQKRQFSGSGTCPWWNCTREAAYTADNSDFYPGFQDYFAWFGLYNSSAGCSTIVVSRACLLHDTVMFYN